MARLTVASTPSIRLSFRSIRAEQEAQVIPAMARSTSWDGDAGGQTVLGTRFLTRRAMAAVASGTLAAAASSLAGGVKDAVRDVVLGDEAHGLRARNGAGLGSTSMQ